MILDGLPHETILRSLEAEDSAVTPLKDFYLWLDLKRQQNPLTVRPIAFGELEQWHFTQPDTALAHRSGKFFTVEGLRVETDFGPLTHWEQPIINQPEVGILGFITRSFGGVLHFLVQGKVEPGNINGVQLTPTLQATRSNYTLVHGGNEPPYSAEFLVPGRTQILVDRLMTEQGSRFLRKRNRNMIVLAEHEISCHENFCWLTLGQIKQLLKQDNLVNMSMRSVLSSLAMARSACLDSSELGVATQSPSRSRSHRSFHSNNHALNWLSQLRARYQLKLERRPLDQLAGWVMEEDVIRHESGRHFSVAAIEVTATARETAHWTQPILRHSGHGLNGFLVQRMDGVLHFLVQACMFPGHRDVFKLGSTIARSNPEPLFNTPQAPPFLEYFRDPPAESIRFNALHSEEGGRFLHHQSRYMIVELPENTIRDLPAHYCWMTLSQLALFNHFDEITIEGRNLMACLDDTQFF
ncbi:NDP-hexose 2,3-dehydratase family protein [Ottowia thiooxydans]|uniref:NDP-hexose 2,3-dehydratase family protein n=1 Tax=Ottowia thiooxydans TaxID=219182 RepID=UPI00040B9CAC|nr:NDP-hexose 2,3-dehydratase family protein [Ottowia thiooxydans]